MHGSVKTLFDLGFQQRKTVKHEWLGIVALILGMVIFVAPYYSPHSGNQVKFCIIADVCVIAAQVMTTIGTVYQKKFMIPNVPPLQAIGYNGLFGFVALSALFPPIYLVGFGEPFNHDVKLTLEDLHNNWQLMLSIAGTILSITFFNVAENQCTMKLSGSQRMLLDSLRSMIIWSTLFVQLWQHGEYFEVIGSVVMLSGMCVYNYMLLLKIFGAIRSSLLRLCDAPPAGFQSDV